jgi:hypothetical protein
LAQEELLPKLDPLRLIFRIANYLVSVKREGMVMDVIETQAVVIIGVIFLLALVVFKDWFFGKEDIDDSKGFPHSRDKQKKK